MAGVGPSRAACAVASAVGVVAVVGIAVVAAVVTSSSMV